MATDTTRPERRICRDCRAVFLLVPKEAAWFETRGISTPQRCERCRRMRSGKARRERRERYSRLGHNDSLTVQYTDGKMGVVDGN